MKLIIRITGSILAMLCLGAYFWFSHFGPAENTLLTEMLLHKRRGRIVIRTDSGSYTGKIQTRLYVRDLGLSGAPSIYLDADESEYGQHRGNMFCSQDGSLFLVEIFDRRDSAQSKRLVGYDFQNHKKVMTDNAGALLSQRGGKSSLVTESSIERRPRYWELKPYSALE